MKKQILLKSFLLFFSSIIVGTGWTLAQDPGDILITEYMADPTAVTDGTGEYFELYNNTSEVIDINGWTIKDDGTDSHVISSANGTTEIPAYGFLVLGLGDGSYNNRDYQYSESDFRLSNTADQIILRDELQQICRTEYVSGFILSGIAMELNNITNQSFGVTIMSNQVLATYNLSGDYGSPGFAGNTLGTDQLAPVGSWNLTEGETDVAADFVFTITFDEGILNTTTSEITDDNVDDLIIFKKTDENGVIVDFDATIDVNKKIVSISSHDDLSYSQLYFLVIGPVEDAYGNTTDGDTLTFTTIAPPSNDATLSDIKVDGESIPSFINSTFNYSYDLTFGTTVTPTVTATENFEFANAEIFDAIDVTSETETERTTTITVTAEDNVTTQDYTILFNVLEASTDATLSDLKVNESTISGFSSSTYHYEFELEAGATETPEVTATVNFEHAKSMVEDATDVTSDTEADRTTTITVTAEDGATEQVYTIVFSVAASTGINELANGFKLYPNPNNGLFTIELNNRTNANYTVEVYDVIGKIVYKSNITENVSNIDLTHMNAGLYYISVNKADERNVTKIMIQ